MDLHNLPSDFGREDPYESMRVKKSLFGPFGSDSSQPAQPFNFTWPNPFEAVTAEEYDAQAMDRSNGATDTPQDSVPVEQSPKDDGSLSPLDDRIQTLYDTYHTSYAFPINETSAHMQQPKDLALALLQRHHPESEDYLVEPAALGPYSAKGINFILKESNESDSDPDTPSPKKQKRSARKTKTHYSFNEPWHHIEPEHMAAFVVRKGVPEAHEGVQTFTYCTHTCLAVILDDLSTFQRWSRANMNHRGDVPSDLLGVAGGVEKGHGMLIFGARLEVSVFDANDDNMPT